MVLNLWRRRSIVAPLALLLVLGCGSPRWRSRGEKPASPAPLGKEAAWVLDPAVSPDDRSLAYASDRDGAGAVHLWLRPVAGGDARRLTDGPYDDHDPAFSPDGRTLAYRSEAAGGGIYLISIEGGKPRLLVKGGHRPRFSPDGRWIAFWAALPKGNSRTGLFLIDTGGGELRAIHSQFHSARDAAWSPDGRSLIFTGCRDADSCDWWVGPAEGAAAMPTGSAQRFREKHLAGVPPPDVWVPGNTIIFAGKTGEKTRLWAMDLTPDPWRAGTPWRLTSGDGDERSPAAGRDGRIVFASRSENVDLWSLPLDADQAKRTGALSRLTTDPSIDQRPSLSLDGKRVAWETSRGGNFEVWVKDLPSGQEKGLTSGPLREHMPALSRDGAKLVYDAHDGEKVTVFESAFGGGEPVKVSEENVGQGSFQWTAKGDSVLYFHRQPPGTVGLMNLVTKERTVLLRHPKFNLSLADARLSPDGRSIAFPVPFAPHRSRLAVARLGGKVIEDERDWTWLTPESFNASQPEWSPNGRWLYFLSDLSGTLAVWALPLSAAGKPREAPRLILDFPGMRLTIAGMRPRDIGLSVAKDKLALGVAESSGGLWSVRP
ncbi:MAG: hypothetical protein ACKV22_37220 [Bryobacteraceae bacterium]